MLKVLRETQHLGPSSYYSWAVLVGEMASDTKRQNAGARVPVALPKGEAAAQPATSLVSLDVSLQQAIGSR